MSFFNLPVPRKEKPIIHHPWHKTIKDVYSHNMKYAHNSVTNPEYPQDKKKDVSCTDRVKIGIIGNRVTKEFIYCVNLVKGLNKYRPKYFDAPFIRGVTTVEWPGVWEHLKAELGGLTFCLSSQVAVLINGKFLGGVNELKELVETKFLYHLSINYYKESVAQFASYVKSSGRPCAYMHITIEKAHIGSMIFMLYADVVPNTCENFLRLCKDTKGGYSGTPVHRIVEDGWIQCGGYCLKNTNLACENFIVPFDRRGVLAMANAERDVDCSTQFFVLLQPAPWMENKYVAFGQLIDGEATLKKIESVPAWYEAPQKHIEIYSAGILNLDCHDVTINKGANEYIQKHIEDLINLGETFYGELLEKVFLEIDFRRIARLKEMPGEGAEEVSDAAHLHPTKRFLRKKEDIQNLVQGPIKGHLDSHRSTLNEPENNEFDVEVYDEYEYEAEESTYRHVSLMDSIEVRPEKPYYIPLTDVPYPGEVDSVYDLKKFLKGDYCLESDIKMNWKEEDSKLQIDLYCNDQIYPPSNTSSTSMQSLDSDDEMEVKWYIIDNVDKASFAGDVIKGIARSMAYFRTQPSDILSDEELRRLKLIYKEAKASKRISIQAPIGKETNIIKRKATGFFRPLDLESMSFTKYLEEENEEDNNRKVRIAQSAIQRDEATKHDVIRRPTGFARGSEFKSSFDNNAARPSAFAKLYNEVTITEKGPTLKDYRPLSEMQAEKKMFLVSSNTHFKLEESMNRQSLRPSLTNEESFDQKLDIQHGKKGMAKKVSSDYMKTISQTEKKNHTSIRTVEYAKNRPTITVSEYQKKNRATGIRLPGDTPLYSQESGSA